jgi:hypothetical protein
MRKDWYLALQPIITANWKAASDNVWTVPVGGGIGRIMRLKAQPVNITAQFYGNAAHPSPARLGACGCRLHFYSRKSPSEHSRLGNVTHFVV